MTLRFTILGCGSSGGVPRLDGNWGKCDPAEPRNRRRRCSALIERLAPGGGRTRVLIDTSPDLREQILSVGGGQIDAVVFTHDHADHTAGIDDLRIFALNAEARVPVYFDAVTGESLRSRFGYCFASRPGSSYPPILKGYEIAPLQPFRIAGRGGPIELLPFLQRHADIDTLGLRIAGLAYSPDVSDIPAASLPALAGLEVWVLDALRYQPHPSHFSVGQALDWIERLAPRRAILTHLHIDLDYATLVARLPAGVEPAYDGLALELPG